MFADSLPGGFGNALVDAALAAEGVAATAITSLDRLVYLGRRGTGALEYHPPHDRRGDKTTAIDLAEIVVAARAALKGDLASQPEQAIAELIRVGTSAGGRDAKAIIAWNRQTGEIAEAFRRMVFNVLAGNTVDHTKNHSFLMTTDGTWSLAPAYDLTFTYNPRLAWASTHQMSINGVHVDVAAAELHSVGDRFQVPGYKQIINDVTDAVSHWATFADEAGLPDARRDEIAAALHALTTTAR